jgi:predicted PurR-regulated permease PerM
MTRRTGEAASHRPWVILVVALGAVIAVHLLPAVAQLLLVLFGAVVLAVVLDGATCWVMKRFSVGRGIALLLVSLLVIGVVVGVGWLAGAMLAGQFDSLSDQLSRALERVQESSEASRWRRWLLPVGTLSDGIGGGRFLGTIGGMFSTVFGVLGTMAILAALAIYLVAAPELYLEGLLQLIPRQRRERWELVFQTLATRLRWWFLGRLISMAGVGVLTALGLWMVGVPMALALGVIAGILSFVPYVGAIAGAIPGVLVAWIEDTSTALYAIAVYTVVQTIDGYVLTPVIDRRSSSLPPALLIASQLSLGVLFGAWGIIWAAPLTLVSMVLVQMLYLQDVLKEDVEIPGKPPADPAA